MVRRDTTNGRSGTSKGEIPVVVAVTGHAAGCLKALRVVEALCAILSRKLASREEG